MSDVNINCPVCGSNEFKNLSTNGSPILKGQNNVTIYPVICECSMVFLSPRWSKQDYHNYYSQDYDESYRLELKPDIGIKGVEKNAEEIFLRLKRKLSLNKKKNIIDIGSGYGITLKYFKNQIINSNIFGIEPSKEGSKILEDEIRGKLVTDDFDNDQWIIDYASSFDLIIMRHVFEHLLNPNKAIIKLKSVLKKDGLIYIAVPDMLHPRIKLRDYTKWTEYWFRVVHPYYYNKYTLASIIIKNGLDIIDYSEENCELWMIIGTSPNFNKNTEFEINMKRVKELQNDVFDRYLDNFSLLKI